MSNLNKVLLMGRLTKDPELRYTPQGIPVTEIGLAINRDVASPDGERRKEVTFVDVTLWRRRAEVVCQWMKKGSPIFIEGRLSMDKWETPDGQRRSRLRVVADNFQFVGARSDRDGAPGGADGAPPQMSEYDYQAGGGQENSAYASRPAPRAPAGASSPESPWTEPAGSGDDRESVEDRDIPF